MLADPDEGPAGVGPTDFDPAAARAGIGETGPWSIAEKRLVPLVALVVAAWIAVPFVIALSAQGFADRRHDRRSSARLLLFVIPDGTGRAILNWEEANRAPWGVIMMFGGGLALAAGIGESGSPTGSAWRSSRSARCIP